MRAVIEGAGDGWKGRGIRDAGERARALAQWLTKRVRQSDKELRRERCWAVWGQLTARR